ncbi:MAG: sugar phosphate isomerase/epimerase family protein [Sedimentisphaerales bacterium]
MKCLDWPVGVCSWSLGNDFEKIAEAGVDCVHLAIAPALADNGSQYLAKVAKSKLKITAAMINFPQEDYSTLESIKATGGIVPDDCWRDNRKSALKAIELTAGLKVRFLSTHFGFIDMQNPAKAQTLTERTRMLADKAGEHKVTLLMETGQESAGELRDFLEKLNHPALGVNFDPANMILYGKGNPVEAVGVLGPWIKHVHIKDAMQTKTPGTWGSEVVWGTGEVGADKFLKALKIAGFAGALAVEREGGDDRLGDIKAAVNLLNNFKLISGLQS